MWTLSNRQAEIAGHLALGKTEKEVAGMLFISESTVHTHKKSIFRALGVRSVADLTLAVAEHVTQMNVSELIRTYVIEPNVRKICTMLIFLSLQITSTIQGTEQIRTMRNGVKTVSIRAIRTRKTEEL